MAVPSYRNMGDHTETTEVDFDTSKLTYEELLNVFWKAHSPTRTSSSIQYRCVVFYNNDKQKALAEESLKVQQAKNKSRITTTVVPATHFTLAEDYHQKFYLRQKDSIMEIFESLSSQQLIDSPAAARLNALTQNYVSPVLLKKELPSWSELTPKQRSKLLPIIESFGKDDYVESFCSRN